MITRRSHIEGRHIDVIAFAEYYC